jgi:hypothetical protein
MGNGPDTERRRYNTEECLGGGGRPSTVKRCQSKEIMIINQVKQAHLILTMVV